MLIWMDSFQVIINLKKETSYKSVEEETFVTFYFIYETSDTTRYNTVIIMTLILVVLSSNMTQKY